MFEHLCALPNSVWFLYSFIIAKKYTYIIYESVVERASITMMKSQFLVENTFFC
jgi:hypothetical protein